ncbi:hypothetical protein BKA81DRAFT_349659 [Phyllosticta paracitricarpa]
MFISTAWTSDNFSPWSRLRGQLHFLATSFVPIRSSSTRFSRASTSGPMSEQLPRRFPIHHHYISSTFIFPPQQPQTRGTSHHCVRSIKTSVENANRPKQSTLTQPGKSATVTTPTIHPAVRGPSNPPLPASRSITAALPLPRVPVCRQIDRQTDRRRVSRAKTL